MILNPLGSAGVFVCEPAEESTLKPGVIPHVLPGENKFLTEFTVMDGVPEEPTHGGAETLYPEYRRRLATLPIPRASTPASPPAVTTRPPGAPR
jgi:hypothetical protein